jgi:hypothetical protein
MTAHKRGEIEDGRKRDVARGLRAGPSYPSKAADWPTPDELRNEQVTLGMQPGPKVDGSRDEPLVIARVRPTEF